jgi:hypothetical protein
MQNVEVTLIAILLLLGPTPSVADVGSELARCELEAQRVLPAPPNKGAQIGRTGQQTYRSAPKMSKRACGRPAISPLQNVLRPSRPTKAV